ncbi:hypothetical protein AOLI_G00283040 [Acnodon oligacanthus]
MANLFETVAVLGNTARLVQAGAPGSGWDKPRLEELVCGAAAASPLPRAAGCALRLRASAPPRLSSSAWLAQPHLRVCALSVPVPTPSAPSDLLLMASGAAGQAPASLTDVLDAYVSSCGQRLPTAGGWGLCADGRVVAGARGVLLSEGAESSFSLLPFYPIVTQRLQHGAPRCQQSISLLLKAAELLETLCVNLFLFPWRKEIRTLKKYTGHFVYYIEPGLPNQTIQSILRSIGYRLETDTEYMLADDADPDVAKRMGFELFLARLECEHLLEAMGQKSHAECLEIVHKRAAPLKVLCGSGNVAEEQRESDASYVREEVLEDDGPLHSGPKSGPVSTEDLECLQSLRPSDLEVQKVQVQENTDTEERKSSRSFMSEDRSILEMQENYPDLAFRQKPIFRKSQKSALSPKSKDRLGCREATSAHLHTVDTDLSGPQSIALHTETTAAHRKLQIPEQLEPTEPWTTEEKQPFVLRVGKVLQSPVFSSEASPDDGLVSELAERMCKLQMKEFSADEPLKYPIEETAQAQQCPGCTEFVPVSPLCPPEESSPPVLCRPSQQPVCSIAGCGSCSGSAAELQPSDPIKEPPHSFYIPNCLSGCSAALVAPAGRDQNCSEGSSLQLHRSPMQQPEDDLVQTFVVL